MRRFRVTVGASGGNQRVWGYVAAISGVLILTVILLLVSYVLPDALTISPYLLVVLCCGLIWGYESALLAFVLGVVMGALFLLGPFPVVSITSLADIIDIIVYLIAGVIINVLVDYNRQQLQESSINLSECEAKLQNLRKKAEHYRTIVDIGPDFAYRFDVDPAGNGTLAWVSGEFTRITRFHPREVASKNEWRRFIHPEDWPKFDGHWQAMLAGQVDGRLEYRVVSRNGDVYWLQERTQPIWGAAHERVEQILGAVVDTTPWRAAAPEITGAEPRVTRPDQAAREQVIEERVRMKTVAEIGATIAHELLQPLTVIMAYLELLEANHVMRRSPAEIYATMRRAAEELAGKIRDFGRIRRYVTKSYGTNMTVLDLERAVEDTDNEEATRSG